MSYLDELESVAEYLIDVLYEMDNLPKLKGVHASMMHELYRDTEKTLNHFSHYVYKAKNLEGKYE